MMRWSVITVSTALASTLALGGADVARDWDPRDVAASQAISKGNLDEAAKLYSEGANIDAGFEDGLTTLMMAAASAEPKLVEFLLMYGAKPNLTAHRGQTALMLAARRGRIENVKLLVKHGARVDAMNFDGETAETLARAAGFPEIAELLAQPSGAARP